MKKIAIVGAGLTGITIAQTLNKFFTVTVFEKSRGVGGRMATRYCDGFEFDHGAQYFTAKSELFNEFIKPLIHCEIITRWNARFVELNSKEILNTKFWGVSLPHYVGKPSMNRMCQYLANDLNVHLNTKIKTIKLDNGWRLYDEEDNDLGIYDWLIVTAPAEQSLQLMPISFKYIQNLRTIKMQSCYSLMLGFEINPQINFDAALVRNSDISWVSVNSSKPGRPDKPTLLINSTNDWAEANMNTERKIIIKHLFNEFERVLDLDLPHAKCEILHYWRYANIGLQTNKDVFVDFEQQLAACGDWCIQGRVESAFLAALNVANQILA